MAHGFEHPILGQEAICPDGLGRVIAFKDELPHQWIQVSTYVKDRACKWDPCNVTLLSLYRVPGAPCYNPSLSDKEAFEVATLWHKEGQEAASARFHAIAVGHKFLDYEALMLMDKVRHHYAWLQRDVPAT